MFRHLFLIIIFTIKTRDYVRIKKKTQVCVKNPDNFIFFLPDKIYNFGTISRFVTICYILLVAYIN